MASPSDGVGQDDKVVAEPPPALVTMLYLLARDELPLGTVTGLVQEASRPQDFDDQPVRYSNPHLAAWARDMAERIVR